MIRDFRLTTLALASALACSASFAQAPGDAPPAPAAGANVGQPAGAPRPPTPGIGLPPPPLPTAERGESQTLQGQVTQWLFNPNGEADGLILDNGTQVSFPPFVSAKVTKLLDGRPAVQVEGTRVNGAPVLMARRLTNLRSHDSVVVDDQAPGAPRPGAAPPPPAALSAMTSSGRVTTVLYAPRGEVNGVLLDNGSAVRFPPQVGGPILVALKPGATIFASGYGTRTANGTSLEATRIGSSEASAQDLFSPLAPQGRPQ